MIQDKVVITIDYNSPNAMQQYGDGLEVKEILYSALSKINKFKFVQSAEMQIE